MDISVGSYLAKATVPIVYVTQFLRHSCDTRRPRELLSLSMIADTVCIFANQIDAHTKEYCIIAGLLPSDYLRFFCRHRPSLLHLTCVFT
jgi:hypothetical protein